jgi:hypothetical protein
MPNKNTVVIYRGIFMQLAPGPTSLKRLLTYFTNVPGKPFHPIKMFQARPYPQTS